MIAKQLKGIRPHLIVLIQVSFGIVLLFPLANFSDLGSITGVQWTYLLILGGVHICMLYILMHSAFQKLPTPVIAVMSFIYPVVAIGVDHIFYVQSLILGQLAGIALLMFGSFAANQNLSLFPRNTAPAKLTMGTK